MANDQILTDWLDRRRTKLGIRFIEIPQLYEHSKLWHDRMVTMHIDGNSFAGRAQDARPELALEKACSELIERISWVHQAGTSPGDSESNSGCAGHRNLALARRKARFELIERDGFLCHMISRTPFQRFEPRRRSLETQPGLGCLRQHFESRGVSFRWGRIDSAFGVTTIVCCAFGNKARRKFGVVIGLSAGTALTGLATTAGKAFLEASVGVMNHLENPSSKSISPTEFGRSARRSASLSDRLALHPSSSSVLEFYFRNDVLFKRTKPTSFRRFFYRELKTHPIFKGAPLVLVQAQNPDLQKLYFSEASQNSWNHVRLAKFCAARSISLDNVDFSRPHYFG